MMPVTANLQEMCTAWSAYTRDMEQLADRTWKEATAQQLQFATVYQHFGDRQLQALGKLDFNEFAAEQLRLFVDVCQDAFERTQKAMNFCIETEGHTRASLQRFEPLWWEFNRQAANEIAGTVQAVQAAARIGRSKKEAA